MAAKASVTFHLKSYEASMEFIHGSMQDRSITLRLVRSQPVLQSTQTLSGSLCQKVQKSAIALALQPVMRKI